MKLTIVRVMEDLDLRSASAWSLAHDPAVSKLSEGECILVLNVKGDRARIVTCTGLVLCWWRDYETEGKASTEVLNDSLASVGATLVHQERRKRALPAPGKTGRTRKAA